MTVLFFDFSASFPLSFTHVTFLPCCSDVRISISLQLIFFENFWSQFFLSIDVMASSTIWRCFYVCVMHIFLWWSFLLLFLSLLFLNINTFALVMSESFLWCLVPPPHFSVLSLSCSLCVFTHSSLQLLGSLRIVLWLLSMRESLFRMISPLSLMFGVLLLLFGHISNK